MTCGIYALYWEKPDLVYIGQSIDMDRRWLEHKRDMQKGKHINPKVQKTYDLYGYPEHVLLQKCKSKDLNTLEAAWVDEFDSMNTSNGLNILEPGNNFGSGTSAAASKFTDMQVLLTFRFLYKKEYTPTKEIIARLGISRNLVENILGGLCHIWLRDKYPFLYKKMQNNRGFRTEMSHICRNKVVELVSPTGEIVMVRSIAKFAKDYGLSSSGVRHVINGRRMSHKGWKLKK